VGDVTQRPRGEAGEQTGSLAQLLASRAREAPGSPFAYVDEEGPWTYGMIAQAAAELARDLQARGVRRGGRVAIRVGNDERFAVAAFAIWAIGAVVVPMHPRVPRSDAAAIHEVLDLVAIVGDPADELATASLATFVPLDRIPRSASAGGECLEPDPSIRGEDPALILLTSGTTGTPKGVPLTHANAWSNLRSTVSAFSRRTGAFPLAGPRKPPNLVANPLSHTAGILRLLLALYVGRRVVIVSKFRADLVVRLLQEHGIDNLTINPTMIRILLEDVPEGSTLGAVRYVSSGTAPLPPALRERFEERFGVPVLQAYGQTEAFGGIAVESVHDVLAGNRRPASVGKPLPGVEVRLMGRNGHAVPTGEEGEIQVRSGSMSSRYAGGGDAATLTDDGWLKTGDLGKLDRDGYLYVTGRVKNLIITGGFNIYPEEIEARLAEDPAVREALVLGAPDERLGEIPVALVEVYDAATDADGLLQRVNERLVAYKRPRRLFTVPELPRVANGKADRGRCRALVDGLLGQA
jgi:long-chain acyl-CoA synthetase